MSFFDLSHYKLFTCNQGPLIPCGIQEVLPGDVFQHHTSLLIRTTPLLTPVMHPVHASVHHWFVPFRLVWEDWEKFITGGEDGEDASVYPTITVNTGTGWAVGSLADYFGLPTSVDDLTVSALPFRAYNLIYNEFYRDQQLQTKIAISKASGADATTATGLLNRCWEKDRFTSARPDPQLGPEVTMPLGTSATVKLMTAPLTPNQKLRDPGGGLSGAGTLQSGGTGNLEFTVSGDDKWLDPNGTLYADLSTASAASINQLREAFAIQRFQENRSRYGGRYPEYLMQLGIVPSDARLQRPEYLGGGKQTVQFSEVLQTAPAEIDSEETPVGNMAGHGIGAMRSRKYRRFFEEHGFVISLASVKPVTMYMQGLPRLWNRRTKFDFWQKELQHIGSDEILNKELKADHASPTGVFGYLDKDDEYRHAESSVAGEFRTTYDMWHMARKFSSDPALNSAFVTADPTDRIYSTGSASHQLLIMANHKLKAKRLMAQNGTASAL